MDSACKPVSSRGLVDEDRPRSCCGSVRLRINHFGGASWRRQELPALACRPPVLAHPARDAHDTGPVSTSNNTLVSRQGERFGRYCVWIERGRGGGGSV